MKCQKCKSDEVYFKPNGIHIEVKCMGCTSHIKFISKNEFAKLNIDLPEPPKTVALF
jgi:hypothetical protein